MKDTTLRKQIVDCLRYIKKGREYGYYIQRDNIEVLEDTIDTTYNNTSIAEIIEGVDPKDYSNIFVRGCGYDNHDGFPSSQVEIFSFRKQTDKEYFETLCSYILPTEYQSSQYEVYLRLKRQFESE